MKYEHDGMTIWSGTPDAPAPGEVAPVGKPVSITIGVRPQNASHEVKVLYRVNNSPDKPKALEAAWTLQARANTIGRSFLHSSLGIESNTLRSAVALTSRCRIQQSGPKRARDSRLHSRWCLPVS